MKHKVVLYALGITTLIPEKNEVVDTKTGEVVHKFDSPKGSHFWLVTAGAGRIFSQSNRHLYAFASWGHDKPVEI